MRKLYFLVIISIFLNSALVAQSQLTLYQLNAQLPQANQINAGLFPEYKITVGLPVLSSTYVSANSGQISFNRAFSRSADDSLHFDPQKLSENLDENNRLEISANTQLFYFGLKLRKNYFSIALNERAEAGITYPKTFIELLASGNGDRVGELLAFDNFGLRAQAYHELAFGYGRDITEKLSVGIRAKFLSGIASVSVDNVSAALLTSTDSLYLYTSAFNINTTGIDLIENGDIFKAATGFNNSGFAIDLGAHYWITEKIRVSLSVNDMGGLNWKNNTQQIQFDEVRYSFTGIDFIDAIDESNNTDLISQETDSLKELYDPDIVDGIGYKTKLSPKFYAGGSYHLNKNHTFGATFYGDVFNGTFNPAFGLSYNLQLGHIWTIGVNASYKNKSFSNIGIGTTIKLGPVQIFALTENVTAFTNLADARLIDARVGINLVFGSLKKKPKTSKSKEKKEKVEEVASDSTLVTNTFLGEVTIAIKGSADDELKAGYYIVIASFSTKEEADNYSRELHDQGYAALYGYQSEKGQYYTYLMYFPEDGSKAIEKKNDLENSLAPGMVKPWVLLVQEER